MFGRSKGAAGVAAEALETISPYADRLATDEKLRRRLVGALGAALAAQDRARRQAGLAGIAARLGSDRVLRAQLADAVEQLQKAKGRMEKRRSHKVRNAVLLAAGLGAAAFTARKLLGSDDANGSEVSENGAWRAEPADAQPAGAAS